MLSVTIVQIQASCKVIDEPHATMSELFHIQDNYSPQRKKVTKGNPLTLLDNKFAFIPSERIGLKQYYLKELYQKEI